MAGIFSYGITPTGLVKYFSSQSERLVLCRNSRLAHCAECVEAAWHSSCEGWAQQCFFQMHAPGRSLWKSVDTRSCSTSGTVPWMHMCHRNFPGVTGLEVTPSSVLWFMHKVPSGIVRRARASLMRSVDRCLNAQTLSDLMIYCPSCYSLFPSTKFKSSLPTWKCCLCPLPSFFSALSCFLYFCVLCHINLCSPPVYINPV